MIYRVEFKTKDGESRGYEYYGSLATMDSGVKIHKHQAETFAIKFPVPKTKRDVLEVLNRYGGHCNNG